MSAGTNERARGLPARLAIYQSERFPVVRNGLVLAAYAGAMVAASAALGGRPLPGPAAFAVAFLVVFALFFQLRVCDEVKDRAIDARHQPDRPVPRGLVSLREVVGAGIAAAPLAALAAALLDPRLLLPLAAVWTWMALMAAEFFAPDWLRARPLAYLVSHMLVVPLIALFATACEWLVRGAAPPPALGLLLAFSFANGCVTEFGRKTRAPQSERTGVETYSALWGPRRAVLVWAGSMTAAFLLCVAIGVAAGAAPLVAAAGLAGLLPALVLAARFAVAPTPAREGAIDRVSGLWVLGSSLAVGFLPLAQRAYG